MDMDGNFQQLVTNFLSNRYQHIVLNDHTSFFTLKQVYHKDQYSVFYFFLCTSIINDLSENLNSTVKIFAGKTIPRTWI